MVTGYAVELYVDAAVPRSDGGAGNEGTCGQGVLQIEQGRGDVRRPSRWRAAPGRGHVYARSDQEATGGPEASVRAQV
ncbi:hypothetical protein GCM10018777_12280 [Streptomyces albogriseolus]|nr:hypothetical protein GCM10018777_12280 [Streptomyces viridodiastaticus]